MEIKTLRCEICGKTYHSDEVATEMVITVKEKDKEGKSYECICPKCQEDVAGILRRPGAIDELKEKYSKLRFDTIKLVENIKALYGSITGSYYISGYRIQYEENLAKHCAELDAIKETYHKKLKQKIELENELASVKKSRNNCISWLCALVSGILTLVILRMFGV